MQIASNDLHEHEERAVKKTEDQRRAETLLLKLQTAFCHRGTDKRRYQNKFVTFTA